MPKRLLDLWALLILKIASRLENRWRWDGSMNGTNSDDVETAVTRGLDQRRESGVWTLNVCECAKRGALEGRKKIYCS